MSKIVSQMSGIVRNTESNRLCAAGRLSLKRCSLAESGCKGKAFFPNPASLSQYCFFFSGLPIRFIYNSINSAGTRGNQPFGRSTSECRSRKEVFQPHLPVRLPCYDLAPITCFTLGRSSRSRTSGPPGFHGLTGGVYKARERIHRAMADARLLANPASWSRVADSSPN